jgi:tetratricopeptide (TPR) repeat protein
MVDAFRIWKDRLPNASRWLHLAMAQSVAQRPVACLESLENVDLEGSRYARSGWMWTLYAECHRSLGDYRASLERAREGRSLFPDKRDLVIAEALALAGLGRAEELNQLIDAHVFEPASGETFEHDRVFSLLVDTGLELRAGGHRRAADEILSRAVDWYTRRSHDESSSPADRWRLARALYASERWDEARDEFSGMSAQNLLGHGELVSHNIDVSLLGYRATLASRLGDEEEAARLDEELARLSRPHLWGHATYWRSVLAAVRGERELAVDLLGKAMAEGLFAQPWGTEYPKWSFLADPDFDSVRDYGPFQELVGPRG